MNNTSLATKKFNEWNPEPNSNPQLKLYLEALESCLSNQADISHLEHWWETNNSILTHGNVIIEFASLLEKLIIAEPDGRIVFPMQIALKGYANTYGPNQYKYFSWTNKNIHKIIKGFVLSGVRDFYTDYTQCLDSHAPQHQVYSNPEASIKINIGTNEYRHLCAISEWVCNKSEIKDCKYVFQAILKDHSELVLYSEIVFKAACRCPHKLFRLFLKSDFGGYNLGNGEALLSLLSLPLAKNPDEKGPAHLTPDYPFFGNDIFAGTQFRINDNILPQLTKAWRYFYCQYNSIYEKENNNKIFTGGDALFQLAYKSIGNDDILTPTDLTDLLTQIEANIWCVQYWLHLIFFHQNSSIITRALISSDNCKGNPAFPDYLDYYFAVSLYLYNQEFSDISGQVMMCGIIAALYWSKLEQNYFLTLIKDNFSVIYNQRRTESVIKVYHPLMRALSRIRYDDENAPPDLLVYNKYLAGSLTCTFWSNIKYIGIKTKSNADNSPVIKILDLNNSKVQNTALLDIADSLIEFIGASLNTNGGDIIIKMPVKGNRAQIRLKAVINSVVYSIYGWVCDNNYQLIKMRLLVSERKNKSQIRIHCYRGSQPVYINRGGSPEFFIFSNGSNTPELVDAGKIPQILSKRFANCGREKSVNIAI